jgi:3-oxoacyl-[acyl-carrier-protein] synthase III
VTQEKITRIVSVGSAVPERVVTNKDLEKFLDTSDEWISTRTGIRQRHVFANGEEARASDLGGRAAMNALTMAGRSPLDVDGIICATFSPDYFFPSTACKIQQYIGNSHACAFDVSAACAGFVYALAIADAMIVSGRCRRMLVVGAEVTSRTLDWTDRSTCILFGDGAGAVFLEEQSGGDRGILATYLNGNGAYGDILSLPAWGEKRFMKMNGNEVYRHAVRLMGEASELCLKKAGISLDKVDIVIPHQANIRIINAMAKQLGLPRDKLVTNLDKFGNTSSASIPIALEDAWKQGRIKEGTVAVFTALGGGLAWGSAVVRF